MCLTCRPVGLRGPPCKLTHKHLQSTMAVNILYLPRGEMDMCDPIGNFPRILGVMNELRLDIYIYEYICSLCHLSSRLSIQFKLLYSFFCSFGSVFIGFSLFFFASFFFYIFIYPIVSLMGAIRAGLTGFAHV